MRKFLYLVPLVLIAGLLAYNYSVAPEGGSRALLARAIQAHGGDEALPRTRQGRIKGVGRRPVPAHGTITEIDFVWEETFQLPDKARRVNWEHWFGKLHTKTLLYTDGKLQVFEDKELKYVQEGKPGDIDPLGQLIRLRQSGAELTKLLDTLVRGKEAVGFETRMDIGKLKLYFLRDRNLLVKLGKSKSDPDHPEEDAEMEILLDEYREFEGVLMPTRITMQTDGRVGMEMTVKEIKFLDKIDEATFTPPR